MDNDLTRRLAARMAPRLLAVAARRDCDFVVGGRDSPYLRRWWLVPRNPFLNVYLHEFLRSDDDRALHDHPWWSLSLLIKGCMVEHCDDVLGRPLRLPLGPGEVRLRSARFAHRLALPARGSCWTLFVTGPVLREWGFHCRHGWVPWRDFTRVDDAGSIGAGCEAQARRPMGLLAVWRTWGRAS